MIDKQAFGYTINCDSCSESEDFDDAESFMDAVEQAKKAGWRMRKIGDDWEHQCPACTNRWK